MDDAAHRAVAAVTAAFERRRYGRPPEQADGRSESDAGSSGTGRAADSPGAAEAPGQLRAARGIRCGPTQRCCSGGGARWAAALGHGPAGQARHGYHSGSLAARGRGARRPAQKPPCAPARSSQAGLRTAASASRKATDCGDPATFAGPPAGAEVSPRRGRRCRCTGCRGTPRCLRGRLRGPGRTA